MIRIIIITFLLSGCMSTKAGYGYLTATEASGACDGRLKRYNHVSGIFECYQENK